MHLVRLDHAFAAVDRFVLGILVGMAQEGDGDADEVDHARTLAMRELPPRGDARGGRVLPPGVGEPGN